MTVVVTASTLQTCIVHLIRNSLAYANRKDRTALAAAVRTIYSAPSPEAAEGEPDAFEQGLIGKRYPTAVGAWREASDRVAPFFVFPLAESKVIYTTTAIESINARLHKIIETRGHFPNDDAASKLKANMAGAAQPHCGMGPGDHGLEGRGEPVRHPLRRTLHQADAVT